MFSIANLIDRAKAGGHIESDYRLGKVIGITHQAISGYRAGISLPKDKVIAQLCALSGDDPHLIVAQIQAERASSPEAKNLWATMVTRLAGAAQPAILSMLFAISLIAGGVDSARAGSVQDPIFHGAKQSIHCLKWRFCQWGSALARLRRLPALWRRFLRLHPRRAPAH